MQGLVDLRRLGAAQESFVDAVVLGTALKACVAQARADHARQSTVVGTDRDRGVGVVWWARGLAHLVPADGGAASRRWRW